MASRELKVYLVGDSSKLEKSLATSESKMSKFGTSAKAMGTVVAGGIAAGVGFAVKAFNDFDAGLDAVRISSGKTGKGLESLEKDFRSVNRTVVSTEEEVGKAVGVLSQRLGVNGKQLQDLAKQTLNLSRITKTDLNEVLDSTTRLFGDFSIATDKQADALDFLFRTSQKTSVPLSRLSQTMVQFGAPLRQLGFDFETTATLIGKFEKEGVNTEAVMAGLKVGLANIAESGKPVQETFLGMIEQIKNAKTPTEALTLGIETFGKRAGPDLVAAIREGRFDGLGPMIADLRIGRETINKATEATDDFKEHWTIAMKGVKELVTAFATPALEELSGKITDADGKLKINEQTLKDWETAGRVFWEAIVIIAKAFNAVGTAIGTVTGKVYSFAETHPRLAEVMAVLGSAAGGLAGQIASIAMAMDRTIDRAKKVWEWLGKLMDRANTWLAKHPSVTKTLMTPGFISLPGLAAGGPVSAGQPYVVGEKGPEVFVPNSSGTIVPNGASSAGGMGTSGDVVFVLDGEVIGRVAKKYLLREGRRNVSIGLA